MEKILRIFTIYTSFQNKFKLTTFSKGQGSRKAVNALALQLDWRETTQVHVFSSNYSSVRMCEGNEGEGVMESARFGPLLPLCQFFEIWLHLEASAMVV